MKMYETDTTTIYFLFLHTDRLTLNNIYYETKVKHFFSIEFVFMINYGKAVDMRFIGRVLHNFTFHDQFACFSYVHGLQRDV